MRDGQAGLGHPPWEGGEGGEGGGGEFLICSILRDLIC